MSGSMIGGIVSSTGTQGRGGIGLTDTQTSLLKEAGLAPGSKEWKDAELKFKIQNLSQAVSMANEMLQSLKEMRQKSIDGISR